MGILMEMVARYQKAGTYADAGEGRLAFKLNDQPIEEKFAMAVSLVRPDRIRVTAYEMTMVSDGQQFHAATSDLPDLVIERAAAVPLTLEAVYSDPYLTQQLLTERVASGPPQLELLLGENPVESLTGQSKAVELLAASKIDEATCDRVAIEREDGSLILWIDSSSRLLRRIEYPTIALQNQIQADGTVTDLTLSVDFIGARRDEPIDDVAFAFEVPESAQRVKRLLGPPPPPPSALLGKEAPDFKFPLAGGGKVERDGLAGRVVVLEFWASGEDVCLQSLSKLALLKARYASDDRLMFLTVNVDPVEKFSDNDLQREFAREGIELTIGRDPGFDGARAFGVTGLPSRFVIGADGVVQDHVVGINPQITAEFPEALKRLLDGKSLAEERSTAYARILDDFQKSMQEEPQGTAPTAPARPVPATNIALRTDPRQIQLAPRFRIDQVKSPGNILFLDGSDGATTILVQEGFDSVAELSADGTVVRRHDLGLGESAVVAFLRTAVDGGGQRTFVGSASAQQQLHVYDGSWVKRMSYPEGEHPGIADVLLADLDRNGELELVVSYWDVVGVHGVTLAGQRMWAQRGIENVFRLALGDEDESAGPVILATHGGGDVAVLDGGGQVRREFRVGGRFLRSIHSADLDRDGQFEYCGIAATNEGEELLVGFNLDGEELWSYAFPQGVHQTPVEMLTSGPVGSSLVWCLAAADGSIQFIDAAGNEIDSFCTGVTLHGVALGLAGGENVLVVSGDDAVEAWIVTNPVR
jgi:thiol-disulfide isomerase/thioredoxin